MNAQVKSAVRVLDLLELLSGTSDALTVSEVARRLQWPKSSTQALLLTLVARGYLVRQDAAYQLPAELRGGWVGGLQARLLGLARPIMEAMAKELGVVATKVGGIGELVSHGESGWLVDAGSAESLADGIRRYAADPELCRTHGRHGRRRVMELHDIRDSATAMAELFRGRIVRATQERKAA